MKNYIERNGQTLKVEVYYKLGGMNYFTYKDEKRGYWLSVSPVSISKSEDGKIMTESYTAFSGTKIFLKEVKRSSEKSYNEAIALAKLEEEKLIMHVLRANGIVKDEEQTQTA
jgi:hypothetical protein